MMQYTLIANYKVMILFQLFNTCTATKVIVGSNEIENSLIYHQRLHLPRVLAYVHVLKLDTLLYSSYNTIAIFVQY